MRESDQIYIIVENHIIEYCVAGSHICGCDAFLFVCVKCKHTI